MWCSRSTSAPIRRQDAKQSHLVGKAAPAFDLPNLAGGHVTLADIAGKAAIVNFWNTWCIPCQQEAPALKQFYAAHADDSDFAMVGIVRERRDERPCAAYVRKNGVDWTIALDPEDQAALDFATRGQPETYAISPERRRDRGEVRADVDGGARDVPGLGAVVGVIRQVGRVDRPRRRRGVVLAVVLWPSGRPVDRRACARLETEFKCPECQGLSVADSQAPTSRAIRADIKRRIAAGQSDAADPPGVRRPVRRDRSS